MNCEWSRKFVTAAAAWLLLCGTAVAEIYKTVDADGNVVYTDRPPNETARPMELPGLSVIGIVKSAPRPKAAKDTEAAPIRDLRRSYRDFAIVSPKAEETFWGTGDNEVVLAWNAGNSLQAGMTVTFYVDGEPREPSTEPSITVERLDRGAHTVYAELWDALGRKIATADSVNFYMQQYSVNYGANRNPNN